MRIEFERHTLPGGPTYWEADGPLLPNGEPPDIVQEAYERGEINAWLESRPKSVRRVSVELYGDCLWRVASFSGSKI